MDQVRALAFDIFGTVVDWREGVAREAARLVPGIDGHALAGQWRAGYQPALEAVRSGARPWANLDVLHGEVLARLLPDTDAAVRAELTLAWHRLDPWPDVREGMARLRRGRRLVPASNGHIALIVDLSRHAGLSWDAVLGAEVSRAYKPQAAVYEDAARLLGLEAHEVMMVAAHPSDLNAAAKCGLRTAYIHRADEYGRGVEKRRPDPAAFDIQVDSLIELAERLGC